MPITGLLFESHIQFIPNVGTVLAVALPLPLVILDPAFSSVGVFLVCILPLSAHGFAGNVLEPLLFGHTLKLHPVTVLLSLLFWGALWGVTGMVLAVPMTAVMRIRLDHIPHPMPQFVASLLVGNINKTASADDAFSTSTARTSTDQIHDTIRVTPAYNDGDRDALDTSGAHLDHSYPLIETDRHRMQQAKEPPDLELQQHGAGT